MALLAVGCSALLCRTKPTDEDDDATKPRGPEKTKRALQVLAAPIAQIAKEKKQRHNAKLTCRKKRRANYAVRRRIECRFLRSGGAPCSANGTKRRGQSDGNATRTSEHKYSLQVLAAPIARANPKNRATQNDKLTCRKKRRNQTGGEKTN